MGTKTINGVRLEAFGNQLGSDYRAVIRVDVESGRFNYFPVNKATSLEDADKKAHEHLTGMTEVPQEWLDALATD